MGKIITYILIFIMMSCNNNQSEENYYQIKDRQYLNEFMDEHKIIDIEQLKNNAALYILNNGFYVVLNNEIDVNYGLLFKGRKLIDEMVKNDHFPMDEYNEFIFFKYLKKETLHLVDSICMEGLHYINNKHKVSFNKITPELYEFTYNKILSKRKIDDKELFYLSLFLGTLLKEEYNGRWFFLKEYYCYNPYYQPCIMTKDEKYVIKYYYYIQKLHKLYTNYDKLIETNELLSPELSLKKYKKYKWEFVII